MSELQFERKKMKEKQWEKKIYVYKMLNYCDNCEAPKIGKIMLKEKTKPVL